MRIRLSAAAIVLAWAAVPVAAAAAQAPQPAPQVQGRVLAVPARSSWQHAETQMILPPRVAGLNRGEIRDSGEAEMDVMASYGGTGVFVTLYLFRTGLPDAALWYDRAADTISYQPEYGLAGAPLPAPTAFVRPAAAAASGLRTATDLPGGPLRSTGIAIAPLGGNHLLKIRMSAQTLDRTALDALLGRFIEGLRWPAATTAGERAAVPIAACPEPLRLRTARVLRPDMTESLMDALTGAAAAQPDPDRAAAIYCREAGSGLQYGVYRPNASRAAYVVALGDSGIAISLRPAISLEGLVPGGGRSRVGMTLLQRDSTSVLLSFSRLPPPAQAVSVAMSGQGSGISVSTEPPRN
ncbi:MAG TPA: hypothetical protein VF552_09425 [Allosphingosinicella sp.]|jgi:hypothetical protein